MSKIVIMLSTYNGEKFLDEQLESIYKQNTRCTIQLLVRDDGSSDHTMDILKKWSEKMSISIIEDGVSLGAAKSFWELMEKAPIAEYYAFVDQDDIWNKDKIQTAIKEMEKKSGKLLWCSGYRYIDKFGNEVLTEKEIAKPILTIESQLVCGAIQGCSMIFNRELLEFVKSKRVQYIPMHDIVFLVCALAAGMVIYNSAPYFFYRLHEKNVVAKKGKDIGKQILGSIKMWFGKDNKYEVSRFANEIIENLNDQIETSTLDYLYDLVACKNSIVKRIKILNNTKTISNNKNGLRSFKIRVLLGII